MKISYGITVHNETEELNRLLEILIKNIGEEDEIIICDDYDQVNYGVKKAVDELSGKVTEIKNLNNRLVKIVT